LHVEFGACATHARVVVRLCARIARTEHEDTQRERTRDFPLH